MLWRPVVSYGVLSPIAIASTLAVGGGVGVGVAPLDVQRVTSPRPLAAAGRTLFLNFEGVTLRLTESFDEDDAVTDTSWLFGGTPDTAPPWGRVVEPADGSMLAMGDPLRVVVQAGDDNAVRSVVLYDAGESLGIGRVAPYTWTLPSPARGTHELYALVTDHAGHEALTEVALVGVGELPADSPTPNLPGRPGGPPLPGSEDVTGCAVGRTGRAPAWWTLFVVLLAAHRTLGGVRAKFRATARRGGRRAPVHGEATQGSA